jgi:hypothetical protein
MATIKHKSPRASLKLTHGIEGYIWWMSSRAPIENNEEQHQHQATQLSLCASLQLTHRLEGY